MLALRTHAFDQAQRLDNLPEPTPGPGQVRVRVAACGISYFDLLIGRGGYQWRPDTPFTVGSEWAGTVDALGPGVDGRWAVGDRVCGALSIGAWAQQVCVAADAAHAVPEGVSLEEAAVLHTPFGTALYGLRERGHLRPGEVVLVLGATGSVGEAAVQVAKAMGARVIATASGAERQAALEASGADLVLDARAADFKDQAKAAAQQLGARAVDVVFDPVGSGLMDTAFRTLGWGGRHLVVGFAGGAIGSLKGNLCIVKGASLVGVDLRQFREHEPAAARQLALDVAALHREGRVRPRVAARYPLADFAQAFARVEARRDVGRVLLLP